MTQHPMKPTLTHITVLLLVPEEMLEEIDEPAAKPAKAAKVRGGAQHAGAFARRRSVSRTLPQTHPRPGAQGGQGGQARGEEGGEEARQEVFQVDGVIRFFLASFIGGGWSAPPRLALRWCTQP